MSYNLMGGLSVSRSPLPSIHIFPGFDVHRFWAGFLSFPSLSPLPLSFFLTAGHLHFYYSFRAQVALFEESIYSLVTILVTKYSSLLFLTLVCRSAFTNC
ncbi:hypothetical protein F5Y08DRAFT_211982 [Xylaria arbuscula]|nr:hypothetical protein F5Y08DRAFT_211982 [Xylaria arbuscula]